MNAFELFTKDSKPAGIFACGQCRVVHRTEPEANQCCAPYHCQKCGKETRRYYLVCDTCQTLELEKKEAERIAAAEKLETWSGPVLATGQGFGPQDGYFASIEDMLDWAESEEIELPEFAYPCTAKPFDCIVSADEIIERCTEELFDGAADAIEGRDELIAALTKFEEANAGIISWQPDYKRVVKIHRQTEAVNS